MIALFLGLAYGAVQTVEVPPAAVTVFADRARVTRKVALDLPAGRQEIAFSGLPARMSTDGITADARGPGVLRGIDTRRVTAAQIADERVREIAAEIEKLRDERQTEVDAATAAQTEIAALAAGRTASVTALDAQLLYAKNAPTQATSLRTALSAEEARVRAAWREADKKRAALDERIAALERERTSLGSTATDTWTAIVHLDLERAGHVEVDLSYLVTGASWVPRYDVRGESETGKVEVALSALVRQTTGEDWSGVRLTVSSARPSLGTIVPELDPFWLTRPTPMYYPPPAAMAPAGARSKMATADMEVMAEEAAPEPEMPMEIAQATVQIELAATSFSVARPEDIQADGTERKVLLTTQNLDALLRHVIVPRIDPRAWLVGEVKNTADFPLLAGSAGAFLDGAYLGDFDMALVPPGEKFEVGFGIDDRVVVKRTPVGIEEGREKLVGKHATSHWEWRVTVQNTHKRPIHGAILEQIPISVRDDVTVALGTSTISPTKEEEGRLRFPVTIAAGEKQQLTWGYSVEYPADLMLGWLE